MCYSQLAILPSLLYIHCYRNLCFRQKDDDNDVEEKDDSQPPPVILPLVDIDHNHEDVKPNGIHISQIHIKNYMLYVAINNTDSFAYAFTYIMYPKEMLGHKEDSFGLDVDV